MLSGPNIDSFVSLLDKARSRVENAVRLLAVKEKEAMGHLRALIANPGPGADIPLSACTHTDRILLIRNVLAMLRKLEAYIHILRLRLEALKRLASVRGEVGLATKTTNNLLKTFTRDLGLLKSSLSNTMSTFNEVLVRIDDSFEEVARALAPLSVVVAELEEKARRLVAEMGPAEKVPKELLTAQAAGGPGRDPEELEKLLLDHIRKEDGRLDVGECARALGISPAEVLDVLRRLVEKGLVKIGRQAGGACLGG